MKKSPENFNQKKTEELNDLLSKMPEVPDSKELADTEDLDKARIEWAGKVADLLAQTKISLEELKSSEKMKLLMDQAGIDFEQHNENKQ